MSSMTMLWAVTVKELRQIGRDVRMLLLLLGVPVVQVIIFGFAVDLDVVDVPTVVIDRDETRLARTHLSRLLSDDTLEVVTITHDEAIANGLLRANQASAIIEVPAGFERDATTGRGARVQVLLDGTDPNRANVAGATVASYFARASNPGVPAPRSRVFFNPRLESAVYMVPGVAAILLMLITTIVTAMGLSREREMGTLERIRVTPMPAWVVIAGKIIPFVAFGLFDFALALVAGAYVFGMPIGGSLPLLLAATMAYLLVTLGAGLLIATLSSGQQQAFMGGFLFMLPAALLSGIMTPVHSMPEWMQPLTMVNPLRHYAEILRAVLLRGASMTDVGFQLAALTLMGLVLFGGATARFSRSLG